VNLLLNKVPTVSEATAQDFVTCFRASMGKDTVDAVAAVAQTAKSPVSIMLQASLLTEAMDNFGTDYPDFVASKLERAYDASPALRIAAWCCQMREAADTETSDARITKQMLEKMDSPKPLFGTSFVDQCGFPLQLEVKGKTDLSEGLAFSWGGDYTRMREIIDAVKHGHSVDWKDVHERCWQCEPVQDSTMLVELLSVCTSPAKVLAALTKENLCALLKKSKPTDALFLAKDVLKYHIHKASAQDDKYNSPYRTSVWIALLFDKELVEPTNLILLMGLDAPPRDDAPIVDWRENELADAFVWASTHMVDIKMICSDDDPKRRLKFLVDMLVHLSLRLMLTGESGRAAALWSGMFAPLLRTSHQNPAAQRIVIHVAIHGDDVNTKWREPLPSLWALAHGKGTAAHVDKMWNSHRHLLFEGCARDTVKGAPLIPSLAGGILCVSGVIPYELQEAFLTCDCSVDMAKFEDITEDYGRAIKLIRKALEDVVKHDDSKIKIKEGTFKTAVMQEVIKIKAQDRTMSDD